MHINREMIVGLMFWWALTLVSAPLAAHQLTSCAEQVSTQIHVDSGHPWRPPFGLDRVGGPVAVHVELKAEQAPIRQYCVTAYREGGAPLTLLGSALPTLASSSDVRSP